MTAQGIRDALRFGRLLGEAVAPVLDDAVALDAALLAWERLRERECLEHYQWTNRLAKAETITPLEVELYRRAVTHPAQARALMDVLARSREPSAAIPAWRVLALLARALTRRGADRRAVLRSAWRDLRVEVADRRERRASRVDATARGHVAAASSSQIGGTSHPVRGMAVGPTQSRRRV